MGSIDAIEIIGLLAAVFTTAGFVPQAYKTWKTKDVSGLSLPMYFVLLTGMLLWLTYGIYIDSLSVILANIACTLLTLLIIVLIMVYRKKRS